MKIEIKKQKLTETVFKKELYNISIFEDDDTKPYNLKYGITREALIELKEKIDKVLSE